MNHTPGPWVWGSWHILPEDRQAQKEGELYWTLCEEASETLAQGPFGRKSLYPESIIDTLGYECEGIYADNEANARLIAASPELLAACKIALMALQTRRFLHTEFPADNQIIFIESAIAKASPEAEGEKG